MTTKSQDDILRDAAITLFNMMPPDRVTIGLHDTSKLTNFVAMRTEPPLANYPHYGSPNQSARNLHSISAIIIHDTVSRNAQSTLSHIYNPSAEVSYHTVIDRAGMIYPCVPYHRNAWHAGKSKLPATYYTHPQFAQKVNLNTVNPFSLGFALVDHDGIKDFAMNYTFEQFASLVAITALALYDYPELRLSSILGHEHVAPGRKIDPGPDFPWLAFKQILTRLVPRVGIMGLAEAYSLDPTVAKMMEGRV